METLRNEKMLKAFGKHFKKLREEKKISQEKLGLNAGSYQSTVIRIEQGKADPKLSTLIALADAMGIELSDLMDFFEKKS